MGANAQTSVPLFVANSVLTAAQQNISAATGVPVFATTVTRDAAFGGSNKVLAEGQLCYIEASDVVQYYTGAAWATVGPASAGGLVALTSQTTFTTASAITQDNIFSAAYTNYLILCNFTCTAAGSLRLQLRTGGVSAATNYNGQGVYGAVSTVYASRATAQTSAVFMEQGTIGMSFALQIYKPFIASATQFASSNVSNETSAITPLTSFWSGNHSTATSYDGFTLTPNSTQTLTGTYSVYGYAI